MSKHYFGNQYDRPYGPPLLRNWEVPKSYRGHLVDKLGPQRSSVKIISNDRGHLVPGVPRPKDRPWIRFPTTWHLPKKIDRKTADEISGLSKIKKFLCTDQEEAEKSALVVKKDVNEEPQKQEETLCTSKPLEEKTHCPIHDCL
ncbi:hypothetical protein HHI36_012134 [Cryptolaemus montrouzieri]|uniref:Cilia- and flagella-associated protein 126 n=1 Tax=Cryptolaemus montrouzieri TaxID=559131 RepID=A0ABD2NDQ4_9CUCU